MPSHWREASRQGPVWHWNIPGGHVTSPEGGGVIKASWRARKDANPRLFGSGGRTNHLQLKVMSPDDFIVVFPQISRKEKDSRRELRRQMSANDVLWGHLPPLPHPTYDTPAGATRQRILSVCPSIRRICLRRPHIGVHRHTEIPLRHTPQGHLGKINT